MHRVRQAINTTAAALGNGTSRMPWRATSRQAKTCVCQRRTGTRVRGLKSPRDEPGTAQGSNTSGTCALWHLPLVLPQPVIEALSIDCERPVSDIHLEVGGRSSAFDRVRQGGRGGGPLPSADTKPLNTPGLRGASSRDRSSSACTISSVACAYHHAGVASLLRVAMPLAAVHMFCRTSHTKAVGVYATLGSTETTSCSLKCLFRESSMAAWQVSRDCGRSDVGRRANFPAVPERTESAILPDLVNK